jgi:Rps23 Pro-64 3,4-dihydroxylase Tpa1-like proline 4-hydroxylase
MKNYLKTDERQFLEIGKSRTDEYINNSPFPNISFENFFDETSLDEILSEFPDLKSNADYNFKNANENKLATKGEYKLSENAREFIRFLNSQVFIDFLSNLTGIENLIPDPYLAGGGYHELKPGGFLKIHSDFNKHPTTKLDRRINVLVYLNKNWKSEYGGQFELWNETMTECVKKIEPDFNTMAIFSTTSKSYHGNPGIIKCEEGNSRKSIAMYYYTNGRPQHEVQEFLVDHSTIFKARENIDDLNETENYIRQKLLKAKKESNKIKILHFFKALTPPVIWNLMKGKLK